MALAKPHGERVLPEAVLAVMTDKLNDVLDGRRFVALPREELTRHYASLEVSTCGFGDVAHTELATYTVIHHNYSWFTFIRKAADGGTPVACRRAMGIGAPIEGDDQAPLFLDDRMERAAFQEVTRRVVLRGGCESRLAGLIHEPLREEGSPRLGLVYVARLPQPGVEKRDQELDSVRFYGNRELSNDRDQFDSWSRLLIENLHAL